MATIYVDEKYGFNPNDSTISFYSALFYEKGTGNTIIFRNMGSPWLIGAQIRLFDFYNITVIFEPGCVVRKKTRAEGGFWEDQSYADSNGIRRYIGITRMVNTYPNGVNGVDYYTEPRSRQNGALLWLTRCNNAHFIAYGAEFIGVFPYDNPGTDPSTSPTARDFSYEFGHGIFFDQPGNTNSSVGNSSPGPCSWKGGYIHNFSGDGLNASGIKPGGAVTFEDVKAYYNKRIGLAHIHGEDFLYIKDCDVSFNGKADISPVWGTNTRQGITIEPNLGNETVFAEYRNIRMVGNSSCGLGLNIGTVDSSAPAPLNMYFEEMHFENNSDQLDWSAGSAIRFNGTDMFNTLPDLDGDNPLGGNIVFRNIAVWGDVEGFFAYRGHNGTPKLSFDNTVIYNVSTTGTQLMRGDAVSEWSVGGGSFSRSGPHTLKDIDLGNILCIHKKNQPFISLLVSDTSFTEIESSVSGRITYVSPNTEEPIVKRQNTITDNNTIQKINYTEALFPKNTVTIKGVENVIKSTNQNGKFVFSRTGSTEWPLSIQYTIETTGINAEMMVDFKLLRGSVIIPVGQTSATIDVIPLMPDRKGGNRNIILTIVEHPDLYDIEQIQSSIQLLDEATRIPTFEDYGAIGNGIVDDTQAIRNAFANESILEAGSINKTYKVNGTITINQSFEHTVDWKNATIITDVALRPLFAINKPNNARTTFSNLTVEGGRRMQWAFDVDSVVTATNVDVRNLLSNTSNAIAWVIYINEANQGAYNFDNCNCSGIDSPGNWDGVCGSYTGIGDAYGASRCLYLQFNVTPTTETIINWKNSLFEECYGEDSDLVQYIDTTGTLGRTTSGVVFENMYFAKAKRRLIKGTGGGMRFYNCIFEPMSENHPRWQCSPPAGAITTGRFSDTHPPSENQIFENCSIIQPTDGGIANDGRFIVINTTGIKITNCNFEARSRYGDGVNIQGEVGDVYICRCTFGAGNTIFDYGGTDVGEVYISTDTTFVEPNPVTLDLYSYVFSDIHCQPVTPIEPPVVSNFQILDITETQIIVSWDLNVGGTGATEYDTESGEPYTNQTIKEHNYLTYHRQVIRNLQPSTRYYFRATGEDSSGNVYYSNELQATTKGPEFIGGSSINATILLNS